MTFQRATSEGERSAAMPATAPSTVTRPAVVTPARSHSIERLVYAPAADTWPEGSAPLVRWLRSNPEVIGELLGTTLTDAAEEVPGGSDACLFDDPDGHRLLVVVELRESSEGTFGTLMTRMTGTHAQAALWICGSARPEHIAAVSWLNRAVDARFFIARLRAARIGASAAAPILDLTLRPPRAGDPPPNGAAGTPERGRRAEDWREIALGEPTG